MIKRIALCVMVLAGLLHAENWPQFRGNNASGIGDERAAVTEWDVESGKNIKWKTPVAGLGLSSPIVWGDKLFVTTAVSHEEQSLKVGLYGNIAAANDKGPFRWTVLCLDRKSGKALWERVATEGMPKIKRHTKASHANSTCATDGKHVVAFFGSEGLYCYDMEGKPLWMKDLGLLDSGYYAIPTAQWGFASSPIIFAGKVIVQCDVQKGSFIAAFDVTNGKELWRTAREEAPTWSTPTVHRSEGRTQVICNGWKQIAGYDVENGKLLWSLRGGGDIPVPTAVVAHDLIFITNAHGRMAPIYAIRLNASGDITPASAEGNAGVAWWHARAGNYMQTPLVIGEYLYSCRDDGTVTCFEAKTGKQVWREQAKERNGFTASGVASGGHIYYTGENGEVHVIKAGGEYKLVRINQLGESAMATPAISEGVIYFRTRTHLIAVGQ